MILQENLLLQGAFLHPVYFIPQLVPNKNIYDISGTFYDILDRKNNRFKSSCFLDIILRLQHPDHRQNIHHLLHLTQLLRRGHLELFH